MGATRSAAAPAVLVAPLDWGLGHATRCIPIIQNLERRGCRVYLAGSGASGRLLRDTFPALPFSNIPAHEIRYARSGRGLLWKIVQQMPQLLRSVQQERRWLHSFLERQPVDAIISDNRYGLYHPQIPSVFLTHQLEIRTPFGAAGNALLRRFHNRLIQRFSACWVPDATLAGLSGALAHPAQLPSIPTRYVGPLSRFQTVIPDPTFNLVVMLSGPEPQRSIWEAQLLHQLTAFTGRTLLLRGLPGTATAIETPERVTVAAHLSTSELAPILAGAGAIVARCGYSTVMDLAALGRTAILVPTPGQPEQEYLAKHLSENKYAWCVRQEDLQLIEDLAALEHRSFNKMPAPDGKALDDAINSLLARIGLLHR